MILTNLLLLLIIDFIYFIISIFLLIKLKLPIKNLQIILSFSIIMTLSNFINYYYYYYY